MTSTDSLGGGGGHPFRAGTILKVSLGLEVKGSGNKSRQPPCQAGSTRAITFVGHWLSTASLMGIKQDVALVECIL